ncbi:hypothetical protein CEXT_5841 [Caerostris extrusa]|uniref:Uncharacterized protein n=1 Tax=Caerostris extrusa TaxID=172846 RepID=A0AAV4SU36_CAEEX|nr:hypothetical protein CEXT_5841 [Caerostris extrusa]
MQKINTEPVYPVASAFLTRSQTERSIRKRRLKNVLSFRSNPMLSLPAGLCRVAGIKLGDTRALAKFYRQHSESGFVL